MKPSFQNIIRRSIEFANNGWLRFRRPRGGLNGPTGLQRSSVLSRSRGERGYCALGLSPAIWIAAYVLTVVVYLVANAWMGASISRAFREHRPSLTADSPSAAAAADRLIRAKVANDAARAWLETHWDVRAPSSDQIERLFNSVTASEDNSQFNRVQRLERLATGSRSTVWPLGYASADLTAGAKAYRELSQIESNWLKGLEKDEEGEVKREVLLWAINDLFSAVEGPVRSLLRWNGWVQWLTVLLAIVTALIAFQRAVLLKRMRAKWLGGAAILASRGEDPELEALTALMIANQQAGASPAEQTMIFQEEFGRLAASVEERVYGGFGFLLGCLPSLGFVGTILGMGEALLLANGLLSASDREQTISDMTKELGFAFDTTLVALLAGLFVGGGVAWLRHVEHRWLQDFETLSASRFLAISGSSSGDDRASGPFGRAGSAEFRDGERVAS